MSHLSFPNGSPRMSLDGTFYRVVNTCTVDNLLVILFHAFLEIPSFNAVLQNHAGALSEFFISIQSDSSAKNVQIQRLRWLLFTYPSMKRPTGKEYIIDMYGNDGEMGRRALGSLAEFDREKVCSNETCEFSIIEPANFILLPPR